MTKAYEKLLNYVKYDTAACAASATVPSTPGQKVLGADLVKEMLAIGIKDAHMDDFGYVYGSIPAAPGCEKAPKIGFLAHMDVVDDAPPCEDPRIVKAYDGGDILLNEKENIVMSPAEFPALKAVVGDDLIVTNGLTLLGGDNKAGIAEILTAAERLMSDPSIRHGAVKIAFTPMKRSAAAPPISM